MMRVVVDTNVLISGVIKPTGRAGQVVAHLRRGDFIYVYSQGALQELALVLSRPRIQRKYGLNEEDVRTILRLLILRGEELMPQERIMACRDPKDNLFLEVAVAGRVDALATGDDDLLALHPFRGIPIITLAAFLRQLRGHGQEW